MSKAGLDIGTIFYIVIAVVAAITSLVQKKNKKTGHERTPTTDEKPKRTWEEILADTLDIPQSKQVPQPQTITKTTQSNIPKKPEKKETFIKSEDYTHQAPNVTFKSVYDENDIKTGEIGSSSENTSEVHIDFDLRKAVIYSEILNRKY